MTEKKNIQQWQHILRQQQITNAQTWLIKVEEAADTSLFITQEYENILRALENILPDPDTITLTFNLTQMIHPFVLDLGDWERWQNYLQQFLNQVSNKDNLINANLLVNIGELDAKLGTLDLAKTHFEESILRFKKEGVLDKIAFAQGRLANIYTRRNEIEQAVNLCQEAIDIAIKLNDRVLQARLQMNLSFAYFKTNNTPACLEANNLAYTYFREAGMDDDALRALYNIVAVSGESNNWESILSQAQRFIDDLEGSSKINVLSKLTSTRGLALLNLGRYREAEGSYHDALILFSQINDLSSIANVHNNLGTVYTKLEEWQTAVNVFHKSVKLYDELGDLFQKANVLDNLADLYVAQEDYTTAYDTLQLSIDALKQAKQMPQVPAIMKYLEKKAVEFAKKQTPASS